MNYEEAFRIARRVKNLLEPHCERIEIAGSIRRKAKKVGDIEIVAIPKPYNVGLFEADGIAAVVNKWAKVKGELPCKYTRRLLPEGIELDLFLVAKENWGYHFAIRTGPKEYSHRHLAARWCQLGYSGKDGFLNKDGKRIAIPEEVDLYNLLHIEHISPEAREQYR